MVASSDGPTLKRADRLARAAGGGLLFTAVYACVLWLNPATVYSFPSGVFPAFLTHRWFLAESLTGPGGPVACLAALLSQLYYWPWCGALLITLVAAGLCMAMRGLLQAAANAPPRLAHFVPPILMAMASAAYAYALAPFVAVLGAVAGAWAYASVRCVGPLRRLVLFAIISVPLYYALGGGYLLFVALCVAVDAPRHGRRAAAALNVAWGAAMPVLLGVGAFGVRPWEAVMRHLPLHRGVDPRAYLVLTAALVYCVVATLVVSVIGAHRAAPLRSVPRRPVSQAAAEFLVVLLAGSLAAFAAYDPGRRSLYLMEYYAHQRMWPQVLAQAARLPPRQYSMHVNMTVNWALYHEGRLGGDMLRYPQHRAGLLHCPTEFFMPAKGGAPQPESLSFTRAGDICCDLGLVNHAEHLAQEALEDLGWRPWLLERMAVTNLAKGRTGAARTYLRTLSGDLVRGRWARDLLAALDAGSPMPLDPEVARLQALMPVGAGPCRHAPAEYLRELLEREPRNRMAFEYLMAYHLLSVDLEGFAANLHRLPAFGYSRIPRHYEEAMLLQGSLYGAEPRLPGLSISPEARRRFADFNRAMAGAPDALAARRVAERQFRDSYFAYFHFMRAPST